MAQGVAFVRALPQGVGETVSEADHLISKAGVSVEDEVPPVAREAPRTHVGDPPVRRRFDLNDEIHATTIWAADLAAAEDDLTALRIDTDLPRREAERDQDRVESLGYQARTTMSPRVEPCLDTR